MRKLVTRYEHEEQSITLNVAWNYSYWKCGCASLSYAFRRIELCPEINLSILSSPSQIFRYSVWFARCEMYTEFRLCNIHGNSPQYTTSFSERHCETVSQLESANVFVNIPTILMILALSVFPPIVFNVQKLLSCLSLGWVLRYYSHWISYWCINFIRNGARKWSKSRVFPDFN